MAGKPTAIRKLSLSPRSPKLPHQHQETFPSGIRRDGNSPNKEPPSLPPLANAAHAFLQGENEAIPASFPMGKKAAAGAEPMTLPGQRSIASMFSNPRFATAGGSGNGRAVPLMEFLNRKSEKRGSLQGCVVDAGLTLAVRERLDAVRKNDTRSAKQDERGDDIGRVSVDECTASCSPEESPPSEHWRGPQVHATLGESMQDKLFPARVLDRSNTHVQEAPRPAGDAGCEPAGRHDWEGHLRKNATEIRSIDFIDLTEEEDSADGGCGGEACLHEERSEINRKRKRSPIEGAATEICPVCNELFPREMLQAHVESELDDLERLETDPVSQAQDSVRVEDGVAWVDKGKFRERSMQFNEPGINCRPRQSVLVLGDEPRRRRRVDVRHNDNRPSSTFNHYADGGGWWDEGGVGVDAEAVGSASVWEGLGSMSFGGML